MYFWVGCSGNFDFWWLNLGDAPLKTSWRNHRFTEQMSPHATVLSRVWVWGCSVLAGQASSNTGDLRTHSPKASGLLGCSDECTHLCDAIMSFCSYRRFPEFQVKVQLITSGFILTSVPTLSSPSSLLLLNEVTEITECKAFTTERNMQKKNILRECVVQYVFILFIIRILITQLERVKNWVFRHYPRSIYPYP